MQTVRPNQQFDLTVGFRMDGGSHNRKRFLDAPIAGVPVAQRRTPGQTGFNQRRYPQ